MGQDDEPGTYSFATHSISASSRALFFVPQAEAVKKATGAVVVGVGGIVDPDFADRLVREGRVDLVAIGRPLLKDPQWFTKAIQTLTAGT